MYVCMLYIIFIKKWFFFVFFVFFVFWIILIFVFWIIIISSSHQHNIS